jgi:hypothetical protein
MGLCATIGEILIFGAIHIGGWNFHFASFAEQLIWRVASVSCTAIPPLVFLAVFYMGQLKRKRLLVVALVVGGGTVSYIVTSLPASRKTPHNEKNAGYFDFNSLNSHAHTSNSCRNFVSEYSS